MRIKQVKSGNQPLPTVMDEKFNATFAVNAACF